MTDRHVVFSRHQIELYYAQMVEFPDIAAIDFVYTGDGEPIRVEYLWRDEE